MTNNQSKHDLDAMVLVMRDAINAAVSLGAAGESRTALHQLHKECGAWQRRIWAVLNPPQPNNEQQQHDANRALREFTNDQRVIDFIHKHKLVLEPGSGTWYWCKGQTKKDGTPRYGAIEGLKGEGLKNAVLGIPRITNGELTWIERQDGTLFLGHQRWFKFAAGGRSYGVDYRYSRPRVRKGQRAIDQKINDLVLKMLLA